MRFAEERGLPVHVQTVLEADFGVQHLPDDELRNVVETMESESEQLLPDLQINRDVWLGEIARLRLELDSRASTGTIYWEGAVTAYKGNSAVGRGYLELTGYWKPMKL